jgi:hypothetical protein
MLDNQNYGYRIQADAMSTILQDSYIRTQPDNSIRLAILLLGILVGLLVYVLSFRLGMAVVAGLISAYYGAIYLLGQAGYLSDPMYAPIAIVLAAIASLERATCSRNASGARWSASSATTSTRASRSSSRPLARGRADLEGRASRAHGPVHGHPGFTSMSETMRADDVLAVIQDYLDEMSTLHPQVGRLDRQVRGATRSWRCGTHR